MAQDITFGRGVEIKISNPEDFLKIKETLTRIGIASKQEKILYQSVHILHKKGRYFLIHFKELFELDGKNSNLTDNDIGRRNTIAQLLQDWGLVSVVNQGVIQHPRVPIGQIKIIPFKEKKNWQLSSKYSIGNIKNS